MQAGAAPGSPSRLPRERSALNLLYSVLTPPRRHCDWQIYFRCSVHIDFEHADSPDMISHGAIQEVASKGSLTS